MNIDLESHNIIKEGLSLKNEVELDKNLNTMKSDMSKIIINIVDKIAGYAIKAMPVPDGVKDILLDIKKVFKKKEFKDIIPTIINSSLREGLEAIGAPDTIIKDIGKLGEIAKKGGLLNSVVASVDIVANKYIKNNILGDFIYSFFEKVKDGIKSKDFITKFDKQIAKTDNKIIDFKENCNAWYKAYNDMNIEEINKLAKQLAKNTILKGANSKIKAENRIIQNITKLVNNKNEKLSNEQMQLCQIL